MAVMPITRKAKAREMTAEVREMLQVRHEAEQRGNYEPLGRLQWLRTEHGLIRFPAIDGELCGPDLACCMMPLPGRDKPNYGDDPIQGTFADWNTLCVLGEWQGLPPLRVNTTKPCPKCRHACDVCDGSGKKLCELCGGASWIAGNWLQCPGAGCSKETGNFKPDCLTCRGTGQIREQNACTMCKGEMRNGFSVTTCTRCAGTGKFSTGRAKGSINFDDAAKCKACDGSTFVGEWKRQDEKQFTNATLSPGGPLGKIRAPYLVLGPIQQFAVQDPRSSRGRIFDVSPDSAGDLLVLLVPSRSVMKQKAYLIGGLVREREQERRVSA